MSKQESKDITLSEYLHVDKVAHGKASKDMDLPSMPNKLMILK